MTALLRAQPALIALLLLVVAPLPAQTTALLPPLAFLGFEAGAELAAVGQQVTALGGRGLHCDRSRRDHTVQDCRGTVIDPASGRPLALWLSAIDSLSGILTLSGPVTGGQLDSLKQALERSYGVVGARVQGGQWMQQWIRRGRMLRLTWRIESGVKLASVSLVDGRVLDGWGKRNRLRPAADTTGGKPAPGP